MKISTCTAKAARKRPPKIIELSDGRGIEKYGRVAVDVLVGRLPGNSGGDDDAKEADVGDDRVQRVGRIDEHFAAGAEIDAGVGESAARHQDEQAAQGEEHDEVNIGGKASQTLGNVEQEYVS